MIFEFIATEKVAGFLLNLQVFCKVGRSDFSINGCVRYEVSDLVISEGKDL